MVDYCFRIVLADRIFLYLYICRRFESGCLFPDSNPKRSRAEKTGRESSAGSLGLYRFFYYDVVLVSMAQMEGMGRIEGRRCRDPSSTCGGSTLLQTPDGTSITEP